MKNFNDLSEREVLGLAISLEEEEEEERVYAAFAEGLKDNYPASGSLFDAMRSEESSQLSESGFEGPFNFNDSGHS